MKKMSASQVQSALVFFWNFVKRTIDRFAIVFDAENESNDNAIASNDFAEKWGWFGVMHRLCNQDISKLEKYY